MDLFARRKGWAKEVLDFGCAVHIGLIRYGFEDGGPIWRLNKFVPMGTLVTQRCIRFSKSLIVITNYCSSLLFYWGSRLLNIIKINFWSSCYQSFGQEIICQRAKCTPSINWLIFGASRVLIIFKENLTDTHRSIHAPACGVRMCEQKNRFIYIYLSMDRSLWNASSWSTKITHFCSYARVFFCYFLSFFSSSSLSQVLFSEFFCCIFGQIHTEFIDLIYYDGRWKMNSVWVKEWPMVICLNFD